MCLTLALLCWGSHIAAVPQSSGTGAHLAPAREGSAAGALSSHWLHFTLCRDRNTPIHKMPYFPPVFNYSRGYFCTDKNDQLISMTVFHIFHVCHFHCLQKTANNRRTPGNSAFFIAKCQPGGHLYALAGHLALQEANPLTHSLLCDTGPVPQ